MIYQSAISFAQIGVMRSDRARKMQRIVAKIIKY